ncbi:hypothetical protein BLA29_011947 [Euroglyphus maynei]|uniref:Uncharacterized protein n=1 Tax=Euroglyphus maynei TaxID=6958 RepID=A0A1Y3BR00_EURMA|nr:hypothetical protein BLA29_011947 [Euroglyphus maynei]
MAVQFVWHFSRSSITNVEKIIGHHIQIRKKLKPYRI